MSISAIMTPLADAVRLKTDQSGQLTIPQMTEELNAIPNRSQTDITIDGPAVSIPQGNYKSAANVEIPTVPQAIPTVHVNESGVISVRADQQAGYVAEGHKIISQHLQLQPGITITPSKSSQVAVHSGYFTGGSVIVAGDQDLVPEKIANGANIFGVQGTYTGLEDILVTRNFTTYSNSRVSVIGSYAFNRASITQVQFDNCNTIREGAFLQCSSLQSVHFPNCTNVGYMAFDSCKSLSTVVIPKCTRIAGQAFSGCSAITTVEFPQCSSINGWAFRGASNLLSASFPLCTYMGVGNFAYCYKLSKVFLPLVSSVPTQTFDGCSALTQVTIPECKNIGASAFNGCVKLSTLDAPNCTIVGSNGFSGCKSLVTVSLPKCATLSSYAFRGCTSLTTISLPACSRISGYAFSGCTLLSSIYLAASTVCTLSNSQAFYGTKIGSAKGSIYVPLSLGWDYKTATNWTYFSNRIFSIEGEEIKQTTIKFTIDRDAYTAQVDSTWEEWVNSSYNVDGYKIVDGKVVDEFESEMVTTSSYNVVLPADDIIEGHTYSLSMIPETIQFTIDGTPYSAEDFMTWSSWVDSTYNTAGFKIKETDLDEFIVTSDELRFIVDNTTPTDPEGPEMISMPMYPRSLIENNTTYFTQPYDSSDWN